MKRYTKQAIYNILEYSYHMQMYVYQQLLLQQYGFEFTPYIVAVSKEPVPDKEILRLGEDILEVGQELFEAHAEIIRDVFLNNVAPYGCGHCDFCLTHKKLERAITLDELLER